MTAIAIVALTVYNSWQMQSFLKSFTTKDLAAEADRVAADIELEHEKFFNLLELTDKKIEHVWQMNQAKAINNRLIQLYKYYKNLGDELCRRSIKSVSS